MKKLTKSQQKVFDYLLSRKEDGIPPTVREICEATGFKSTSTVHSHLNTLEKLGYIRRRSDSIRGIFINNPDGTPNGVAVPFIGSVRADRSVFHVDDESERVVVDESINSGRELFAIHIADNSMIGLGILSGDVVVFARQSNAENGDIVAALVNDEITVKKYCKIDSLFVLESANPDFVPVNFGEFKILGKVVCLLRNYE